ncbi:HWE histidine kinase domain-containing protein [Aureimonas jatrophae]|uniref:histidine kinase n=1 Tax=Aureimonas jatrophae TaxID=1166073 RepID=A0A1H0L2P4_9HYPH|nr:HWE histidine kinase domain-containing protein [Aureimonas jatrophae]MBB3952386.1 light-regulated signal transduction histidine kinase (bacteriophytochrome)/CheY-like chemotaxis protein [Aureimonas jatrophae]SDO62488.1 Bacteriophytochrome (light-regulated signal transduction histidine kinase) [Aureimonas jatrophae]
MNISPPSHGSDVDLTNCDREPIQFLGQIQNFGILIAVSMDWLIERVSENLADYVSCDVHDLPGEPVLKILPESAVHAIRGRLQVLSANEGAERIFGFDLFNNGGRFDVAVHVSGHSIVIEAELASERPNINPGALVKSMISRVQKTDGLDTLFRECVRQLRGITGFDRVMLYRFASSGAGSVIAESVRSGLGAFLGLNYPATDIPSQARALYVRNQIRIIADVNAPTVGVFPELDPHGRPLDLSLSTLRSVSPIHLEYLRNMGVSASMSVSIVIDGQLWGLFALHHYAPRHLPMEIRNATELFGQMVSLIVEGRLYKERQSVEEAARALHDKFVAKMASVATTLESIVEFADELREIIPCDGFAVWAKGEGRCFGSTPSPDELPGLARFLNRAGSSRVYATDEISALHPPAADFMDRAAGVLAIPISRAPRDYILFFRREIVQTVTWAGDPKTKERMIGPHGVRLTPRKSFEAWKETVHGRSLPWTDSERKSAEALRVSILEVLLRFNEESERQANLATQRQELLIAELNHRVRNILSLIRALVAQSKPGATDVDEFARIIGGRIQALARAHDQITGAEFKATSLASIIQTEVSAYIGSKIQRVHMDGPDIFVEAVGFSTLALVFHELVTNSAKYGALSDSSGSIDVRWHIDPDDDSCRITWTESGGPPVAPPSRRGFGSTIIERSIPHDLGGEATLDYRLAGLIARFTLPQQVFHLQPPRPAGAQTGPKDTSDMPPAPVPASLKGLRGLIVEDNMIISLDAEQLMIDNGMAEVHIAASVAEARRIIETQPIDVALLDVNLGTETSFPLVGNLNQRGIPFVFVTGYGEHVELPPDAEEASAIKKPFANDQLVGAIARAVAKRSSD